MTPGFMLTQLPYKEHFGMRKFKLPRIVVALAILFSGTACSSNDDGQYILCSSGDAEKALFFFKPLSGLKDLGGSRRDKEILFSVITLKIPYDFSPTVSGLESDFEYARRDDVSYWGSNTYWASAGRYVTWSIDRQKGLLSVTDPDSEFDSLHESIIQQAGGQPMAKMQNTNYLCEAINREQARLTIDDMNQKNSRYKSDLQTKNKF